MRNLNWLPRNTRLEVERKDAGVDGEVGERRKKKKKLNSNHKAGALNESSLALTFIINQRLRFAESTIAEKKSRAEVKLFL